MTIEAPLETGTQSAVEPAAVTTTIADNAPTAEPSATAEGLLFTASDWREKMAGGDEKVLKQLGRYTTPDQVAKALIEAKHKISAGEFKKPLAADASPEDIAAWRQENGIPEAFDKYEVKLSNGLVIGEEEKPFVDEFLKVAHSSNATPDQVNKMLGWYYETTDARAEEQIKADIEFKREAEESLRTEWGADYKTNLNLLNSVFDAAPEGLKQNLMSARMADGSVLGNNPEALKFLAGLAREINPVATVVPGAGAGAAAAAIGDEIAKLTKLAGDYDSDYWKGPNSANMQKRLDDLLAAQARMK
jgi:hypothetical protein